MNDLYAKLTEKLEFLITPPYIYWAVPTVVILILVLRATYLYRRNHRPIVPFKSQGGTVEIAPQTLKGVINLAVASVEGVEKSGCHHRVRGQGLAIYVGIHLRSSVPLKKVESRIKSRIKHVLYEQFGIENVDPIHIKVNRIVGDSYPGLSAEAETNESDFDDSIALRDSDDEGDYSDEGKRS